MRIRRAARQKKELLKELARKRAEMEEMKSFLSDLMVNRWWRSWNKSLELSFSVDPHISSGESTNERVIHAKGQAISWTVVTNMKPALESFCPTELLIDQRWLYGCW